jgi:uncharacterized DUF497 family protein
VELEWDQRKADANFRKHGVDFADAGTVLHDDHAITIPDEESGEARFVTTGLDALGRVLVVVYTWRAERVRVISARSATPREKRQYEETR